MKLVIIEAPAKRETLKKYLGQGYDVFATKGHIRDLPQKSFGVDMTNFEPKYEIMPDKKELISELKRKASTAEEVLIATDPDREGEAIAYHIAKILDIDENKLCRIEFNEISEKAVKAALKTPRRINDKLVNAQQARRVLDRIVGYKMSPIICKKIKPKLSAGRVQSVALKLVVDREKEIEEFKPEEYWVVSANLLKNEAKFKAILSHYKNKKITANSAEQIEKIKADLNFAKYLVDSIKRSRTKSHASAPFTTSTMQQDASNKCGMSLKRTTSAAQQLYEGVEISGEGKVALITYIRTDSTRVSPDAQAVARDFIRARFGDKFLPAKPNIYASKKNAQDAHEAIRPISLDRKPEDVKASLSPENYRLYKLIYERFLASQMVEAEYSNVVVNVLANDYLFKATGKTLEFAGFEAVYKGYEENPEKEDSGKIPPLTEKEELPLEKLDCEQKFTRPPARFTEASLVKAMEEKGIGRPATYSPTITVITTREYVEKEGKALKPTELGRKITDYIDGFFSSIINVKFTAHMEDRLDDIAEKDENWKTVVDNFWKGFSGLLQKADSSSVTMREPPVESDVVCDKCGAKMLIRDGKFGKFLGCANFPKCKNIISMEDEKKEAGKCPHCQKSMLERKSKRGKVYYSCSGYPDCKFMSWDVATGEKCPKCGEHIIIKGKKIKCSACDYVKETNDDDKETE